tara:strand:- start:35 stop:877 length:843 start_codon:yes stop_codon:yes gene_type:complete
MKKNNNYLDFLLTSTDFKKEIEKQVRLDSWLDNRKAEVQESAKRLVEKQKKPDTSISYTNPCVEISLAEPKNHFRLTCEAGEAIRKEEIRKEEIQTHPFLTQIHTKQYKIQAKPETTPEDEIANLIEDAAEAERLYGIDNCEDYASEHSCSNPAFEYSTPSTSPVSEFYNINEELALYEARLRDGLGLSEADMESGHPKVKKMTKLIDSESLKAKYEKENKNKTVLKKKILVNIDGVFYQLMESDMRQITYKETEIYIMNHSDSYDCLEEVFDHIDDDDN